MGHPLKVDMGASDVGYGKERIGGSLQILSITALFLVFSPFIPLHVYY